MCAPSSGFGGTTSSQSSKFVVERPRGTGLQMKRMLINATQLDEVRVAITDDSKLIDLDIEIPGQEQKKSNIYKGIISSIEQSLGAVFVNYGSERHGFLPLKEISREYFLQDIEGDFDFVEINRVLKVGQELVVQIDKEERGTKGAALTTFISLAGSFLVLMPNNPRSGGISRRIEGEERDQLRETINQFSLPEGMSLIVRTAGLGRLKDELEWDLKILLRYWEAVKRAAVAKPGPYLIHQESDVIIRAIRDYLRQDVEEILVDNEIAFENARHYIEQVRPQFIERLKLYLEHLPLFSRFQIEQQIENAHQREIRLPSGGSLIIDHSEALIAIDINSARATRGASIEETALSTNLEAAEEIARQLRIRDIGGLIVIDFIDMTPPRNQREVENCLRHALSQDRARIQVKRISRFGLLEMSRQRLRSSLTRSTQVTCPRCNGDGTIRSIESSGLSIIHIIQEQASKVKNIHFQLQVPVDLATYLINEKRELLRDIEKHYPVKITIVPNQYMETPLYQLRQIKINPANLEHGRGMPSYKLTKTFKVEVPQKQEMKPLIKPVIQQFLSPTPIIPTTTPRKITTKITTPGLFKRLMVKMFGGDEEESTKITGTMHSKPKMSDQHCKQFLTSSLSRGQGGRYSLRKPIGRARIYHSDVGTDSHQGGSRSSRRGTRGSRRGGHHGRTDLGYHTSNSTPLLGKSGVSTDHLSISTQQTSPLPTFVTKNQFDFSRGDCLTDINGKTRTDSKSNDNRGNL